MTELRLRPVASFLRLLLLLLLMTVLCSPAAATHGWQNQKPTPLDPDKTAGDEANRPFSVVEEEMKAKRAIKVAEKEYQENLDRARDLSTLGAAIVASFKEKNRLDQEDLKKLDKLEKLTKGVRRAAGGSEDDTEMENPPANITAAVERLGELSHSLKLKVEKTPKHVISAGVIDDANVLLELVRIVRTLPS